MAVATRLERLHFLISTFERCHRFILALALRTLTY
jgi:hypothetical protein